MTFLTKSPSFENQDSKGITGCLFEEPVWSPSRFPVLDKITSINTDGKTINITESATFWIKDFSWVVIFTQKIRETTIAAIPW